VLFVGSEHPRKNLGTLLRAFARLKRRRRFRELRLVKVGEAGDGEAPFRRATLAAIRDLALERDVVLAGHVDDQALPGYYSGAAAFAFPSLAEGFGLPPLEAMACGCPAVVSTAGALPEVTGGAALTVPPADAAALAGALEQVLSDHGCAAELRARGLRRAAAFSWERAALETRAVYRRVQAGLAAEPAG
jgi:glycosyltransferase involved in cell wall biosynthesis